MNITYVENQNVVVTLPGGQQVPMFTVGNAGGWSPTLVRMGRGYMAVHPFVNNVNETDSGIWGPFYGFPTGSNSITGNLNPLSPTNACYYTEDLTSFRFLGQSPSFPDWTQKFQIGSQFSGQAIQSSSDGSLLALIAAPAAGTLGPYSGDLLPAAPYGNTNQNNASVRGARLKGPYVAGHYWLCLAPNSAATSVELIDIPWAAKVNALNVDLVKGGIAPANAKGLSQLAVWSWTFFQLLKSFLGYDPPAVATRAINIFAAMAMPWGVRAIYLETPTNPPGAAGTPVSDAVTVVDITDENIQFYLAPTPNCLLFNLDTAGSTVMFQAGEWMVYLLHCDQLGAPGQKSPDLLHWYDCAQGPYPFPVNADGYFDYLIGSNEEALAFEIPSENDNVHQIWRLDLGTETWTMFRDWSAELNNENNIYPPPGGYFLGPTNTNNALLTQTGLLASPGATSHADAVAGLSGGSVGLMAGNIDPQVTSIGFVSTKNFVLSNRALAYYQRIGLVRLLKRYL